MEHISMSIEDGIAVITLDRPDKLNAFTTTMENELIEAFDSTDANDAVRAVILTGAGRAFCAGADLSSGAETFSEWSAESNGTDADGDDLRRDGDDLRRDGDDLRRDGDDLRRDGDDLRRDGDDLRRDGGGRVVLRMFDSLKPIIAAINGPAVGVGITLTLAADFRLAADDARMGFVFNRRGLVPESCSSWLLPKLVPLQRALDWIYSGRIFTAAEAFSAGLVYRLHSREDLPGEATALAHSLTRDSAPVSVALSRQMIWRMLGVEHPMVAHRVESIGINARGAQADVREGVAAFLEKREAVFPDRCSDAMPDLFSSHLPRPRW
ncbi:enoyl-CoA hydratase-related protein [Rhodococcus sp. (in: high G+C Gram-positive bacteria)]|uniref:enoyl-CoA hydratase-related protein n=1 Tax=Rhodococcus sp. TaxID=1831 RepID=UPI002579C015|nr:enoyl-CoA hydratase-related protein [Rhodococcus sp. (in: high G+C Gram-positive bacteria)]MBQ7803792.1 enoyl-CoA hydratase/isomerase family protein [Rhodococcus sp. (in: high G+C Gram-positive bacteria)]